MSKQEAVSLLQDQLELTGARVHNLKNIDLKIPHSQLVVITGLSGSGKSSLAFDTIYAEGQRRYMETFSAYARQFIGNIERPDVDRIIGLSPVISIEQKTTSRNPRSTVGTVTEIYDLLRLLYARASDAYSSVTGKKMVQLSEQQIIDLIMDSFDGQSIQLYAPLVKARKGHYRELFEQIRNQGYLKVRIDGETTDLKFGMKVDRYKVHDIEVQIDHIKVNEKSKFRLTKSIQTALRQGKGSLLIIDEHDGIKQLSKALMCMDSGISYEVPEPNTFSFNSPYGACPKCNGLGTITEIDQEKIIPNKELSIKKGGFAPIGTFRDIWIFRQLKAIGQKYDFDLDTKVKDLSDEALKVILYGTDQLITVKHEFSGVSSNYALPFGGIINFIKDQSDDSNSKHIQRWVMNFSNTRTCPECDGARLKKEALQFKIKGSSIADLAGMDLIPLYDWLENAKDALDERKQIIAHEIMRETRTRLKFLLDVGINYLTLNRPSKSLSGGESQRIRLATQIGSQLVGVLYILDEPSIGLHQRDNRKLIEALKNLRDIGNSIIVVEHDEEMIRSADFIVDLGPGAGEHGGKIVAIGSPDDILNSNGLTADYLNGKKEIEISKKLRKGSGESMILKGAKGNNLKDVDLEIPLGKFICVTGVSGSGKSTLINETLYPILSNHFYRSVKAPLAYKTIKGMEHVNKVIEIDQSPIGRTPRSNPATYTGVFDEIRKLYANLPESKIRGYKPGRFSFNVKGGRCEECKGAGVQVIEMNFLPDVMVHCDACDGQRYNRETLEVRYKGKSINDVLNMSIEHAVEFFEHHPSIILKIRTLHNVGLDYLTLGQQSTTLSGGEAQRIKLASELSKKDTGNTLYILDEPTTGLHFEDVKVLLQVLQQLVDRGNTMIVIEHNLDVVKTADHIIDLGPEGGDAGGYILAAGTPQELSKNKKSHTAKFLREIFENKLKS